MGSKSVVTPNLLRLRVEISIKASILEKVTPKH